MKQMFVVTFVLVTMLLAEHSARGQQDERPTLRIVFNDDGQVLFETPKQGAVKFVTDWLECQAEAISFTTFVFQTALPDVCLYETKVGEVYGGRFHDDYSRGAIPGIRALRAAGADSLRLVTEHMYAKGKEVLAAVRMNDTHHRVIDRNNPLCPKVRAHRDAVTVRDASFRLSATRVRIRPSTPK